MNFYNIIFHNGVYNMNSLNYQNGPKLTYYHSVNFIMTNDFCILLLFNYTHFFVSRVNLPNLLCVENIWEIEYLYNFTLIKTKISIIKKKREWKLLALIIINIMANKYEE